jgi:predicted Zn-dependent protease
LCRLQELEVEVEASTTVDLLKRYRRACVLNDAMSGQLDLWLRGHPMTVERRAAVQSLVDGSARTESADRGAR